MKMILVGILVIASAGFPAAQTAQSPERRSATIPRSQLPVTVEFDTAAPRENAVYVRNVTVTIWDVVVTADDAILEKTEMKLGSNARVYLTASPDPPSYTLPVSTTGGTLRFDGRGWPETVTNVQNVTLTMGNLVLRADDAAIEKTEIKLGANARISLPPR